MEEAICGKVLHDAMKKDLESILPPKHRVVKNYSGSWYDEFDWRIIGKEKDVMEYTDTEERIEKGFLRKKVIRVNVKKFKEIEVDKEVAIIDPNEKTISVLEKEFYQLLKDWGEKWNFKTMFKCWEGATEE